MDDMDDCIQCCECFRICCECGLCLGLCCLCCKDDNSSRRNPYYQEGTNVTVTTQPLPPQGVNAPYPPNAGAAPFVYPGQMPMPQPAPYPPPPGGAPYPPPGGHAPYPPGPIHGATPYPAAPYPPQPTYGNNPPPYDVAVGQPPVQPAPMHEGYGKQSPYNPNFQS